MITFQAKLSPEERIASNFDLTIGIAEDSNEGCSDIALPLGSAKLPIRGDECGNGKMVTLDLPVIGLGVDATAATVPMLAIPSSSIKEKDKKRSKGEPLLPKLFQTSESKSTLSGSRVGRRKRKIVLPSERQRREFHKSYSILSEEEVNKNTNFGNENNPANDCLIASTPRVTANKSSSSKPSSILRVCIEVYEKGSELERIFVKRQLKGDSQEIYSLLPISASPSSLSRTTASTRTSSTTTSTMTTAGTKNTNLSSNEQGYPTRKTPSKQQKQQRSEVKKFNKEKLIQFVQKTSGNIEIEKVVKNEKKKKEYNNVTYIQKIAINKTEKKEDIVTEFSAISSEGEEFCFNKPISNTTNTASAKVPLSKRKQDVRKTTGSKESAKDKNSAPTVLLELSNESSNSIISANEKMKDLSTVDDVAAPRNLIAQRLQVKENNHNGNEKRKELPTSDDIAIGNIVAQRLQSKKNTVKNQYNNRQRSEMSSHTGGSGDYDTAYDRTNTFDTNGGGSTAIDYNYSSLDEISTIEEETKVDLTFDSFFSGFMDAVDKRFPDDELRFDDNYFSDGIPRSVDTNTKSPNSTEKKKINIVMSDYDTDDESNATKQHEFDLFGRKITLPFMCGAVAPLISNGFPKFWRHHNELDNKSVTDDKQQRYLPAGFQKIKQMIQKPFTTPKKKDMMDDTAMMTPISPLSTMTLSHEDDDTSMRINDDTLGNNFWAKRMLCFDNETEIHQEEVNEETLEKTSTMGSF